MPTDDCCDAFRTELIHYALAYPEASQDAPSGEPVAKVGEEIFAFLGGGDCVNLTVKLPRSARAILAHAFSQPAPAGRGGDGWVSVRFAAAQQVPMDLLCDLIDESYRAIAPTHLVEELDAE